MKKTLLILKNELITALTRKSFLITLVLLPLTSFIILLVISGLQKSGQDTSAMLENLFVPASLSSAEGFVDNSGLMKEIPDEIANALIRYNTEEDARAALNAYFIVPDDYLEKGDVFYIRPDFNPMGSTQQSSSIKSLIAFNLSGGNPALAYRLQDPINAIEVSLSNQEQRDSDHWLTFFLPYIITFLFYIVILTSSSLLLNSISTEKQNRVMEILLTSLTPSQVLTGKIIALGLTGLLQTVVWLGAGLLMLRYSGRAFALSAAFQLPLSIMAWGVLFFIFGYAVFASLMAGIGALVPNLREGSQLTTVVILPMIIPLVFISALINTPNSPLSVFLSMFPLTAPVSMMTRLSATQVPFWQASLALLLLALTAVFLVRASASLFKAQNLLTGQTFTVAGFLKALAGK